MSTMVCLKEGDTLILGTDSRFMKHDYSGIASDEEQKIFEVAPETFLATSGRKMVCDFQVARARKIADELGAPTDIQVIGEALKCESLPCLMELLELLQSEPDEITREAVTGQSLLHGCVLVGRTASGKLGFIDHSYRVQAGKVECEENAYFGGRRQITFSVATPLHLLGAAGQFTQDPTIWTNPPVKVVRGILAGLKRSSPMIGGPDQIVCLDRTGAHWISRLPKTAISLVGNLCPATITALISIQAPTILGGSILGSSIAIISPTATLTANTTVDGFTCTGSGPFAGYRGVFASNVLALSQGSNITLLSANGLQVSGVPCINSAGNFVGAGVACPSNGIGGSGFSVYSGGWVAGATFTFKDQAGVTHSVKGGILVY